MFELWSYYFGREYFPTVLSHMARKAKFLFTSQFLMTFLVFLSQNQYLRRARGNDLKWQSSSKVCSSMTCGHTASHNSFVAVTNSFKKRILKRFWFCPKLGSKDTGSFRPLFKEIKQMNVSVRRRLTLSNPTKFCCCLPQPRYFYRIFYNHYANRKPISKRSHNVREYQDIFMYYLIKRTVTKGLRKGTENFVSGEMGQWTGNG